MQFRENDLRAMTPSKQVKSIHNSPARNSTRSRTFRDNIFRRRSITFSLQGLSHFYPLMSDTALEAISLRDQNVHFRNDIEGHCGRNVN